ncbi:hypothetical protein SAY86_018792 [Trapa natans]|uniref:Uncharacterized protein n=1 Tax=Trapa natans TaxID=22666 RepID=A0AAN7LHJ8_TRANT|nr:hypothetical protein SAY86_018792 [Trapa natans]
MHPNVFFRKKSYVEFASKIRLTWFFFPAGTMPSVGNIPLTFLLFDCLLHRLLYLETLPFFTKRMNTVDKVRENTDNEVLDDTGVSSDLNVFLFDEFPLTNNESICSSCCEKCKKCPICRVPIEERLPVYDV